MDDGHLIYQTFMSFYIPPTQPDALHNTELLYSQRVDYAIPGVAVDEYVEVVGLGWSSSFEPTPLYFQPSQLAYPSYNEVILAPTNDALTTYVRRQLPTRSTSDRVLLFRLQPRRDLQLTHSRFRTAVSSPTLQLFTDIADTDTTILSSHVQPELCPTSLPILRYSQDDFANVIPDFSRVGYLKQGIAALPPTGAVPNVYVVNVSASDDDDDWARLQTTINALAGILPTPTPNTTIRAVVQLGPGEFRLSNTLHLNISGVVLRGWTADNDTTITTLVATSLKRYELLRVSSSHRRRVGNSVAVIDNYIPVGATFFHVADTSMFNVGDTIIVHWQVTDKWIRLMAMDRICDGVVGRHCINWTSDGLYFNFEREITAIDTQHNTLFIDVPLVLEMNARAQWGFGVVYSVVYRDRIQHVGIEHLRLVANYDTNNADGQSHSNTAISIATVKHSFVRNVHCRFFGVSCVSVKMRAHFVTLYQNVFVDPVSVVKGGYRYPWNIDGSMVLVRQCYSEHARHESALGSRTLGPNVFFNNTALLTYSDTGPHQRFAVGALFDSNTFGFFSVENRGFAGSGHGWAGAQMVYWNCNGTKMSVQSPPVSRNYVIGGYFTSTKYQLYNATLELLGVMVAPKSLYIAQLQARRSTCFKTHITGGW